MTWAGPAFVAEVLLIGPRALIAQWRDKPAMPPSSDLAHATTLVEVASKLIPGDASVHSELGYLLKLHALSHQYGSRAWQMWMRRAAAEFYKALQLRPTWGLAWAQYAQAQFLLGEKGHGSKVAFHRALSLSPHESDTYHLIAWLGFAHWSVLAEQDRNKFRSFLKYYGNETYGYPLVDYAVLFYKERLVQDVVDKVPALAGYLKVKLEKRRESVVQSRR